MTHEGVVIAYRVGLACIHQSQIASEPEVMTADSRNFRQALPEKVRLPRLATVGFDGNEFVVELSGLGYDLLDGVPCHGLKHFKIMARLRRRKNGGFLQDVLIEIP